MADIGKADLLRFRNDLAASGLAPKTVNQTLKVGRMLFKAAKRDGIISENPLEFVANVRARLATNRGTFSLEQLRAILAVADPEWRSLVLFGFYTGQRLGDLARLRWNNVDLVSGRLTLVTAKTGKRLSIPWPVPLRKHIEGLPRGTDANAPLHPRSCRIVESQQGRTGTLSRQFGELLMKSGVREKVSHTDIRGVSRSGPRTVHALSFHSLRRTATTLLHEAGVPQAIAQAFIGHDSPAMHEIYVAVGGEALEKAAAAFPDLL
jgi:integrase